MDEQRWKTVLKPVHKYLLKAYKLRPQIQHMVDLKTLLSNSAKKAVFTYTWTFTIRTDQQKYSNMGYKKADYFAS